VVGGEVMFVFLMASAALVVLGIDHCSCSGATEAMGAMKRNGGPLCVGSCEESCTQL